MAKHNAAALAAESPDFEIIPPGWYTATLESFSAENIGDGSRGRMLKMMFEIDDASAAGRKVWTTLCVWHKTSPEAAKIALRQVAEYLHARGVETFDDDEKLLLETINGCKRGQVKIKVATEKDKTGQYGDKSTIKRFKPADDPRKPAAAQADMGFGAPPTTSGPPQGWGG